MQQIERYGVIALVFLLVTIVAVSFWGDSKSPGFWSRLTGRGVRKEVVASQAADAVSPNGATGERAIQGDLPLNPAVSAPSLVTPLDPAPSTGSTTAAPVPNHMVTPDSSGWVAGAPTGVTVPSAHPQTDARTFPTSVQDSIGAARNLPTPERPTVSSEYVVQKGDNLMQIASRMLGSKSRWTEIRDLNRGIDPRSLRVGTKLAIPASAASAKSGAQPKSLAPVRKSATVPASKGSGGSSGTYVVRKGETLKSIAGRLLGDSARWKEIAASNPGLDPHHISVGTTIRMPGGHHDHLAEPLVAAALIPARTSDHPRVR